jgi:hypothetical protein
MGAVTLEVLGDRLTLRADDAPLAVVLRQLARATGIIIYLGEPVDERVSVDLADVDLEAGIRRLLKHRNCIFLYATTPGVPSTIYVLEPRSNTIASPMTQPAQALAAVSEPMEGGEVDLEAERFQSSLRIEDLEDALLAASAADSSEAPPLLQDLMAEPDNSVRITALQWFAAKGDSGVDALVTALADGDDLVQRVALQIILDHGISEEVVEEVKAAAEANNDRAVRQMLGMLTRR